MKYLLLITLLIFTACSTKQVAYTLESNKVHAITSTKVQIGVKKIEVPEYLNSNKILVKEGNRIKELDANLISTPDSLFTQQAIILLKRKLNDPNVFLYPWDVKEQKGYIVAITIDDYLYSHGYVYLQGSYFIKQARGRTLVAKNFSFKRASSNKADDIIKSLEELFTHLIDEIAQKIAR